MRRIADGRANVNWWYGGGGDIHRPQGYDYSTGNLTTTEDATECTDGQYNHYRAYPTYRVPRSYGPGQYGYPVRRRSRRRVVPFTAPYVYQSPVNPLVHPIPPAPVSPKQAQIPSHDLPRYQMPQQQVALKGRRHSRRSIMHGQRRRSEYGPRLSPLVRRKHKVRRRKREVPTRDGQMSMQNHRSISSMCKTRNTGARMR